MGAMSRTKGAQAERELAAMLRDIGGWEVKRRVRNHAGDSDLVGVPGWSIESKRYASASRGEIAAWWRQTVRQATHLAPVLFYRLDRDSWRAVWWVGTGMSKPISDMPGWMWLDYEYTVEGSIEAWAAVAREMVT